MKNFALPFCVLLILWSCGKNEEEQCAFIPDVDKEKIELDYLSLEDSLVNINSKGELVALLSRYPQVRDLMLNRNQFPNDSVFINELFRRYSNPAMDTLLMETRRVFGNHEAVKSSFREAFANLYYYYPDFKVPKVKTVVTGLMGSDLYVSDSLIMVSLDFFLGPSGKYRPRTYDYLLRQYEPANIVPSTMMIYGISDRLNKTDLDDKTVLADMIAYGKAYYFAKQMLPCTPDSVFIWYTAKETRDSKKNQDLIWARLIQDQVLYATNHMVKQKFLGERPKTLEVGPECPGRIGQFVGWQIVNAFMEENKNVTLPALMELSNARGILERSNYTTKIK